MTRRSNLPGLIDPLATTPGRKKTYSVAFDGTTEYVNIGDVAALQLERTDLFSFTFWVKAIVGNSQTMISKKSGTAGTPGYSVALGSTNKVQCYLSNALGNELGVRFDSPVLASNVWTFVAVTYDGTSTPAGLKCYINGVLVTSTTTEQNTLTASIAATNNVRLGIKGNNTSPLNGNLLDVAIWGQTLTAAQVLDLYNGGLTVDPLGAAFASGLLGCWYCGDGDTYPTLIDRSANANNGTMTNQEVGDIIADVPP